MSRVHFCTSSLFNPNCFISVLPVGEMEEIQGKGELAMQITIVTEYESLKRKVISFSEGKQHILFLLVTYPNIEQCLVCTRCSTIRTELEYP